MKAPSVKPVRCAIYTRVSTDHGLDQEFNSLDAQYDAASAYIKSQAHAGWTLIRSRYDDGGYSGGSTDRPDLQKLLDDIRARKIDVIVVYNVDRLTRSLADFAKLVELFDAHGVSFVSVTQQFNTTTSMGRLTLSQLSSCLSQCFRRANTILAAFRCISSLLISRFVGICSSIMLCAA
jgi:site-specific DNA recombinase